MSKVIVNMSVSFNGVMQAPGRPDENDRGGFEHGGWAIPYNEGVMGPVLGESMGRPCPIPGKRRATIPLC
ncbi:MAG: hypothetical protein H0T69_03030 [Thermoleophilaceae bacterium]|nr:hypothetical protein [Thermoleophilaceae bacterium]